ncbi:swr complex subunit [Diatrype stigma]|uniref:SWR1-complex protein 5 n=1 Tax=Diatrype stigma TaxID=117547 RepID=A0AAN9U8M3_9PEZI
MPPELPIDEDYASDEDSDFAPDAAPAEGASDASESEEGEESDDRPRAAATTQKRKRPTGENDDDDGFENSGDEAIIQKAKKRKKKAKRKDGAAATAAAAEDDEGGEGGLIKTRSMRAQEKAERKSHAITGPVTVDVDDLWAKMTAAPVVPPKTDAEQQREKEVSRGEDTQEKEKENGSEARRGKENGEGDTTTMEPPAMIKIKRTYNFAGKVHTEEKLVSRESAEAKLYLASLGAKGAAALAADDAAAAEEEAQPKSKPRKAFRSMFEPVVEGLAAQHLQRADLNLGMAARLQLREQQQAQAKAKKLNVVEKSRMDWAGYVDQEGIKDELELAGKSKDSYVHRQDFLARVEAHREEDARRARVAGRA